MQEKLPSTINPTLEPWVDAAAVAAHLGFSKETITKMAKAGKIPGTHIRNGARTFLRFKLSRVDAAFAELHDEKKETDIAK
jgi:hypothetical protein